MGSPQGVKERYTPQQYWDAARGYEAANTEVDRVRHIEVLIKIGFSGQEPLASKVRAHMLAKYGLTLTPAGELEAVDGIA